MSESANRFYKSFGEEKRKIGIPSEEICKKMDEVQNLLIDLEKKTSTFFPSTNGIEKSDLVLLPTHFKRRKEVFLKRKHLYDEMDAVGESFGEKIRLSRNVKIDNVEAQGIQKMKKMFIELRKKYVAMTGESIKAEKEYNILFKDSLKKNNIENSEKQLQKVFGEIDEASQYAEEEAETISEEEEEEGGEEDDEISDLSIVIKKKEEEEEGDNDNDNDEQPKEFSVNAKKEKEKKEDLSIDEKQKEKEDLEVLSNKEKNEEQDDDDDDIDFNVEDDIDDIMGKVFDEKLLKLEDDKDDDEQQPKQKKEEKEKDSTSSTEQQQLGNDEELLADLSIQEEDMKEMMEKAFDDSEMAGEDDDDDENEEEEEENEAILTLEKMKEENEKKNSSCIHIC